MDTVKILNVAQTAELFRVSVPVVHRLLKSGKLKSLRVNSREIWINVDAFIVEALKPASFVSVAHAANRLRVSRQTIYNLAKTGKVKSVSVGPGKIKICRTSLFYPDETINYDGPDISRLEF